MDSKKLELLLKDEEMQQHLLWRLLTPGESVFYKNKKRKFTRFGEVYYGRLDNPGCPPGKYDDPSVCYLGKAKKPVPTSDLLVDNLFEKAKTLNPGWQYIDFSARFVEPLPETKFIEGDVVRVVDKSHPEFSLDLEDNQYTVFRIDYAKAAAGQPVYRLRAGKKLTDATNDQIIPAYQSISAIRLFYAGKDFKWRSLEDETEFHILIGNFDRVFNPVSMSYKWDDDSLPLALGAAEKDEVDADLVVNLGSSHQLVRLRDRTLAAELMKGKHYYFTLS